MDIIFLLPIFYILNFPELIIKFLILGGKVIRMDNMDLDKIGFDDVITPQEQTVLLNNLTDELLLENIYEQIEKPILDLYDPTNFIDVFEDRYKFLSTRFRETPDFISALNDTRRHFYVSIYNKICKKFGFSAELNTERIYVVTKVLYEFFILNYKENIMTFITEYINENKKSLISSFEDGLKNLDLISAKKIFKNKGDAVIVSNIYRIIDLIIKQELPAKNILELIVRVDSSEFTNFFINALFIQDDTVAIESEFSNVFFDILIKKGDGYTKIINELQMELFNLFPKKINE
jgi:hypothetical protein